MRFTQLSGPEIEAVSTGFFIQRFEDVYAKLRRVDAIIAATAHHRFLWLHPFLDGKGRVASQG